jgi:hypothetical protein
VSRRVSCEAPENVWLDIVEEPVTAQVKEDAAHSWRAEDVGALETFSRTDRKKYGDGTTGPVHT